MELLLALAVGVEALGDIANGLLLGVGAGGEGKGSKQVVLTYTGRSSKSARLAHAQAR